MKLTPKRGLFRLVIAAMIIAMSLLFARSFPFLAVYAIICIGWAIYWLIKGFFDMD
jgi:hypothetical protein